MSGTGEIRGEYFYRRHRSLWGVWRHVDDGNGHSHGDFVQDFGTREEARAFVYEKNGWNN